MSTERPVGKFGDVYRSKVKSWPYLHPRTHTKPMMVSEYVQSEVRGQLNKPPHSHTTPEWREWLIKQAIKRGIV